MASRRRWLVEQEFADGEGEAFRMRRGALEELGRRELRHVETQFAQQLGIPFEQARNGERIEGVIAGRIDLEGGSYAVVERARDFTLVPWRDVLKRNLGKAASGIMRTNSIDWWFGRGRSGPAIS